MSQGKQYATFAFIYFLDELTIRTAPKCANSNILTTHVHMS